MEGMPSWKQTNAPESTVTYSRLINLRKLPSLKLEISLDAEVPAKVYLWAMEYRERLNRYHHDLAASKVGLLPVTLLILLRRRHLNSDVS
jgi:hypothetical protein